MIRIDFFDARWRPIWRKKRNIYKQICCRVARAREAAGLPRSRLCWGDAPTLADCCLVPQIFNAQRFEVDLAGLPRTMAAWEAASELPAFQAAHPSACPDAGG